MEKYDAIIIGFGKGGKTLATDRAGRGWKVAMIERSEKMYGGTCINIAWIPTKALIHDAKIATQLLNKDSSYSEKNKIYQDTNLKTIVKEENGAKLTYISDNKKEKSSPMLY